MAVLLLVGCGKGESGNRDGASDHAGSPITDGPTEDLRAEHEAPIVDASAQADRAEAGGAGDAAAPEAPPGDVSLCGTAGQACCSFGRCASADLACLAGYCAPCGGKGQSCCAEMTCGGEDLGCNGATCEPCGGPGQTCCRDSKCSGALLCRPALDATGPWTCRGCGGSGEWCCADRTCSGGGCCVSDRCVPPAGACEYDGQVFGTCTSGQCTGCGAGLGAACCPWSQAPARCAASGSTCSSPTSAGSCVKCGGPGEPCCASNTCADGACCSRASPTDPGVCVAQAQACASGGVCASGSCGSCGGLGQPCCKIGSAPPFCTAGGAVCSEDNTCVACGKQGQPCCFDYAIGEPTCRDGGKCDRCPP